MPSGQDIADNINAYSEAQIAYWNQNTDTLIGSTLIGEISQSDKDAVDDDIVDIEGFGNSKFNQVVSGITGSRKLSGRPC